MGADLIFSMSKPATQGAVDIMFASYRWQLPVHQFREYRRILSVLSPTYVQQSAILCVVRAQTWQSYMHTYVGLAGAPDTDTKHGGSLCGAVEP